MDSDDDHLIGQPSKANGTEARRLGCTANAISTNEPPLALHQLGEKKGINVRNEVDIRWHKASDA